jgi:MoxR-like ATPase
MTDTPAPTGAPDAPGSDDDLTAVQEAARAREAIIGEVKKRIVGQTAVVDQMLVSLFARGHCLFVGVPGLAKTLLVSTVAQALDLQFSRIQFTPDLMPSDITGTDILEEDHTTGKRFFKFIKGPLFCNLLLADEINRTPPKTQAALLQAMQEGKVTAAGHTYTLDPPFLVFATQNPIEQEGTYPLPEAQLDRFMFMIEVGYPDAAEELEIVKRTTGAEGEAVAPVLDPQRILEIQELVRKVPVSDHVVEHAVKLVRATRPDDPSAPDFVKEYVGWGAGPRASQYLVLAGKARALLQGRLTVSREDVRALAPAVLGHRVLTNFHAEAERVSSRNIVMRLVETVGTPT